MLHIEVAYDGDGNFSIWRVGHWAIRIRLPLIRLYRR